MRTEIFKRLGGKCVKCGYSDIRALHIDHINGGGRKERNAKGYSQHRFYLNLSKGIGIEKFQLLCANCNWIKLCESREN